MDESTIYVYSMEKVLLWFFSQVQHINNLYGFD